MSQGGLQVPCATSGCRMTRPFCPVTGVTAKGRLSRPGGVLGCSPLAGAGPGHPSTNRAPGECNLKWRATCSPCCCAGKGTSAFNSQLQRYDCLTFEIEFTTVESFHSERFLTPRLLQHFQGQGVRVLKVHLKNHEIKPGALCLACADTRWTSRSPFASPCGNHH